MPFPTQRPHNQHDQQTARCGRKAEYAQPNGTPGRSLVPPTNLPINSDALEDWELPRGTLGHSIIGYSDEVRCLRGRGAGAGLDFTKGEAQGPGGSRGGWRAGREARGRTERRAGRAARTLVSAFPMYRSYRSPEARESPCSAATAVRTSPATAARASSAAPRNCAGRQSEPVSTLYEHGLQFLRGPTYGTFI